MAAASMCIVSASPAAVISFQNTPKAPLSPKQRSTPSNKWHTRHIKSNYLLPAYNALTIAQLQNEESKIESGVTLESLLTYLSLKRCLLLFFAKVGHVKRKCYIYSQNSHAHKLKLHPSSTFR